MRYFNSTKLSKLFDWVNVALTVANLLIESERLTNCLF